MFNDKIIAEIEKWKPSSSFSYGTAGFRARANLLPPVVFRCGILAAARALSVPCVCVGLMITASHNPSEDNGVKLIEPNGSMLNENWEIIASRLINSHNPKEVLEELCIQENISLVLDNKSSPRPAVYIGHDTRSSSEPLARIVESAVELIGLKCKCFGTVTTPQLHYFVKVANEEGLQANKENYFQRLSIGWDTLSQYAFGSSTLQEDKNCANGVGAEAMANLIAYTNMQNVYCINTGNGELNQFCGADFIQKNAVFPNVSSDGFDLNSISSDASVHFCSLDGDADRLVYFIPVKQGTTCWKSLAGQRVRVLEGDRMSVLAALVIKKLLDVLQVKISIGVIQTAYANGASTAFLKNLGKPVQVECVPTGVKHLEKAAKKYDIGIYWEANGHGTILFAENTVSLLRETIEQNSAEQTKKAALCLLALSSIANQATGDGICNFILAEALLKFMGWQHLASWESLYDDLPNCYKALNVRHKELIKTTDQERTLLSPESVSKVIKRFSDSKPSYRFLVRPSGTEDVVRLYGEGPSVDELNDMMKELEIAVLQACGSSDHK